jgi:hypothetical protein
VFLCTCPCAASCERFPDLSTVLSAYFLTSPTSAVKPASHYHFPSSRLPGAQATDQCSLACSVRRKPTTVIDSPNTPAARAHGLAPALRCQGWPARRSLASPLRGPVACSRWGDAPVGGRELVFEADDAPGRGPGHVLIEQFSDPGGQRELGPAVARVRPGYGGNLPLPALMRGAADGLSWSRVRRHSV